MRAGFQRDLRLVLKEVEAHRVAYAPSTCWAAVAKGKGTDWQLDRACRGCSGALKDLVLGEAWSALALSGPEAVEFFAPDALFSRPLRALVYILTLPPGHPVPDGVSYHESAVWYDPDEWAKESLRAGARAVQLYQNIYRAWAESAIAVFISPNREAASLRRQLHHPGYHCAFRRLRTLVPVKSGHLFRFKADRRRGRRCQWS